MDRDALEAQLAEGRSIESIARETGRAASTVAYWVNKHGLMSQHAPRHAARGGIERERLEALVAEGLSIRRWPSARCVIHDGRHWLRRHEIVTPRARRLRGDRSGARRRGGDDRGALPGARVTTFVASRARTGSAAGCAATGAVHRRRRELKRVLVEEAGGACVLCGYDRSLAGLHFHHLDPAEKSFALSRQGVTRSLAAARAEARKCVLLCSNCHAEVEAGAAQLPSALLL